MSCHGERLRETDPPLVKYAVLEQHLKIVARRRWGVVCGGCKKAIARMNWRDHRCNT